MDLTEQQWRMISALIPPAKTRGRRPTPPRRILNGILWILRTGAPWKDMPRKYPPHQTCHRRFQEWTNAGVFQEIVRVLAKDLKDRGGIDLTESFIDGTFVPAKKGALQLEKLSGAKARNSWQLQTAMVFLSPAVSTALRHTK